MPLTQEQIELLGERLVPLFQEFEFYAIGDIVRRLKKTGRFTETAELMAQGMRRQGFSPAVIRSQVLRYVKADKAYIEAINENTLGAKQELAEKIKELRAKAGPIADAAVNDAADFAFNEDLAAWKGDRLPVKGSAFEKLVSAMRQRTGGEIVNLTKTMGFKSSTGENILLEGIYTHLANQALIKTATGAFSYQQALEDAVRELAKSGIRTIDFESGYTRQADAAVRNALITASSQLAGQITMMNAEDTGVELVEVSKHWGARTGVGHGNHAAWQGGIYCIKGTDGIHRNLEEATGYPSDPKGLCGYNCRHVFYPFWEGVSTPTQWPKEPEPVEIDGKTYTYYQATQQQRYMERQIRALKREAYAMREIGESAKAQYARRRAKELEIEYNEFSEAAGISPKPNRLRVVAISTNQ